MARIQRALAMLACACFIGGATSAKAEPVLQGNQAEAWMFQQYHWRIQANSLNLGPLECFPNAPNEPGLRRVCFVNNHFTYVAFATGGSYEQIREWTLREMSAPHGYTDLQCQRSGPVEDCSLVIDGMRFYASFMPYAGGTFYVKNGGRAYSSTAVQNVIRQLAQAITMTPPQIATNIR